MMQDLQAILARSPMSRQQVAAVALCVLLDAVVGAAAVALLRSSKPAEH